MTSFASDNYAPAHPRVLAAIAAANHGHAVSYGADAWSARAAALVRDQLGEDARPFLAFNGTGANVLCLRALLRPWEAVICAASAHIAVDECGAPEWALGTKLLDVPTPDGKLTPALVRAQVVRVGDEHAVQPRVVSITQTTELGTRYSLPEVRALADCAHELGLLLHLDGARIANAAAGLGVSLFEATRGCGVDALSLGLTKTGAVGAELAVVFDPEHAAALPFLRKQSMQLGSKLRYAAAQVEAMLDGELWRETAAHANAMAARLAAGVSALGIEIARPVEANAVFAVLAPAVTEALQREFAFYVWDERTGEVRWMCSWDTTPADVDRFLAALARQIGAAAPLSAA